MTPCLNLEEALKLSTAFSVSSSQGAVPDDLLIPVPASTFCEFNAKPWGAVSDLEREAFKAFYLQVGEGLEDAAALLKQGVPLDEASWADITKRITS